MHIFLVSVTPTEHYYAALEMDAEGGYVTYHSQKRARLFNPDASMVSVTEPAFLALVEQEMAKAAKA